MKNPRSRFWYAAIAVLVFAFIDQYNYFLKLIGWKRFISEWLIVLGIRNFFEVATAFVAVAITGTGGIGFCWFFMKWRDNLWTVWGLHAGMNLWWEVFNVDDTALGGWLANGARLATVIVAVLLTIYKDKIWKPLPSEAENIDINGSEKAAGQGELRYSAS